jgi:signal transduction histidine kinase
MSAETSTPLQGTDAPTPPGTTPRRARWFRLEVVAFVIVPLLVLGAVAATTVALSERIARANALEQAEGIATRFSRLLLAPPLEGALAGDPDRLDDLEDTVANRLSDESMAAIIVWAVDGEILFSSVDGAAGTRYEPSEDVLTAAGGQTVAEVDEEPDAAYTGQGLGPMLEVYVPLDLADERVVVELYFGYRGIEEQASLLRRQLIPLAVGSLVVLQLIQLPIATSLARRVRRQETERAELMARSLTASERDRRAIAADVHDGPVQDLAGVSYALGALRASVPDDRKPTVDRLVAAVRNAVHSLRGLMVDLYPPDLRTSGLAPALEDLAEPLRNQGVTVHVHCGPLPELSADSAAVVYRTAKELLANVARHAGATTAWVEVETLEQAWEPALRLTVSDDGVGLPGTPVDRRDTGHLGLRLVEDRVRDVGGTLALGERPGGGASVTAVIPAGRVP